MIIEEGSYSRSLKEVPLMTKKYKHFESAAIHDGDDSGDMRGSLVPPIFQTSTYTFDTAEQGERRFAGEEDGYVYSDRKSTRRNSSHVAISYAVYCLKKK